MTNTSHAAFRAATMGASGSYHYGYGGAADLKEPDPPPEDEPLTTPDLIEPVIAWRSWTLQRNGDLMSANSHVAWRPGPNQAVCDGPGTFASHEHPAPQENCACGFYGYHDLEGARRAEIIGLFKAWGTIVLHPTGLRAEWAEIALLVVPDSLKDDPRVKRMREHYAVHVVRTLEEAKYRAGDIGQAVPEEMRPEAPEKTGDEGFQQLQWAIHAAQTAGTRPTPGPMMSATTRPWVNKILERERGAREEPKPPELKGWRRALLRVPIGFAIFFPLIAMLGQVVGVAVGLPVAVAAQLILADKLWSLWLRVKCWWHDNPRSLIRCLLSLPGWEGWRHNGRGGHCSHCGWRC